MKPYMFANSHSWKELEFVKEVGRLFEIDKQGRIWRIAKEKRDGTLVEVDKRRAETSNGNGYLAIRIRRAGLLLAGLAHRVVWVYFFGEIPFGFWINHKNGQRWDNNLSNLELVTPRENREDALRRKEQRERLVESRAIIKEIRNAKGLPGLWERDKHGRLLFDLPRTQG